MELEQKKFPTLKKFTLQSRKINVFDKSLTEELEYSIEYLELGNRIVKKKETKGRIAEIFLLTFFLLEFGMLIHTLLTDPKDDMVVFWVLASGLFLGVYLLARFSAKTNLIYITGGEKTLELYQNKPNIDSVDDFVNEIRSRVKNAYRSEYLNFDDAAPKEMQQGQIDWLNRIDMLSDEEAEKLKINLDIPKTPNIGFNKNSIDGLQP